MQTSDQEKLLIDQKQHITEEEAEKELPPQREYSNSNPRLSQVERLKNKAFLGFFERNIQGFEKGSMRVVVITWVRMTMGIGVMTLPYYFSQLGIVLGNIMLFFAAILCYLSYRFVFAASTEHNLKDYKEMVAALCPNWIAQIFKFSLTIDYLIFFIVYSVVSWNLFCYIMVFLGLVQPEWLADPDKLIFNEYHPTVFLIRVCFFVVVYLILVPLLLQKSLENLKYISMIFLLNMIILLIFICAELPGFYHFYEEKKERVVEWMWKPFNMKFLVIFFSLMLFFYVQPFLMSFRKELLLPTFQRLNKVSIIALVVEFVIYLIFGSACYATFGDKYTPKLMILRKSYVGKNAIVEWAFRGLLVLFFLLNTIGIACFNPTFRAHLLSLISLKNKNIEYKFFSLFPYFIAVVVATIMPNITQIFGIIGLLFCNYDGFIIPVMVKLRMCDNLDSSPGKVWAIRALLAFYVVGGAVGLFYAI